jgi:hypothetical protein
MLRWAYRLAAVLVSAQALAGVTRLAVPAVPGPAGEPYGVARQLAFLRAELDGGAAQRAQQEYPEGYFFLYALYGLAQVEVGMREPAQRRAVALREARWALAALDRPAGTAPFDPGLTPAYGVFYRGWTNWLRGGVLAIEPAESRDPDEQRRFDQDSAELGAAFDAAPSPFLTAYPGQAWPVDSTVAIASLRLHDHLRPARFTGTVQRWLAGVRQRLDPATGLLPHRVEPDTGRPIEGARGSSQSIVERFLVDIDPAFAGEQYRRFRDRYVVSPLGLGPAVREYPTGVDGSGDVDSGPLVHGISLSATVVTIGAAQVQGDGRLAGALANYAELAGFPLTTPFTKRYVLGLVPIGDAFLVWSRTARPWVVPVPDRPPASIWVLWRLPLLSLLALVGIAPWIPVLLRRIPVLPRHRRRGPVTPT